MPRASRENSAGRATRATILRVAEQLFAERGIDAVSVSEILDRAGQRNKSAIHYHFGGKEALVTSIAEHRSSALNARRTEVLSAVRAQGAERDTRALSTALVMPLAELLDDDANHFLGFLARFHLDRSRRRLVASVDPRLIESYRTAASLLRAAGGLSRRDFEIRFTLVLDMVFTALAGRQADERMFGDRITPSRPVFVDNLVECVAAALSRQARATSTPSAAP